MKTAHSGMKMQHTFNQRSNQDRYNPKFSTPQYLGGMKDGLKDGHGVWFESKDNPNCNQYRGEFMNDKK